MIANLFICAAELELCIAKRNPLIEEATEIAIGIRRWGQVGRLVSGLMLVLMHHIDFDLRCRLQLRPQPREGIVKKLGHRLSRLDLVVPGLRGQAHRADGHHGHRP